MDNVNTIVCPEHSELIIAVLHICAGECESSTPGPAVHTDPQQHDSQPGQQADPALLGGEQGRGVQVGEGRAAGGTLSREVPDGGR